MNKISAILTLILATAVTGLAYAADGGIPKSFHGDWEEASNQCKVHEAFTVNHAGYGGTQSDCILKKTIKATSSEFVGNFSCDSGTIAARLSMTGSDMLLEETKKGSSKATKRTFKKC